jgi:hypothetical protein
VGATAGASAPVAAGASLVLVGAATGASASPVVHPWLGVGTSRPWLGVGDVPWLGTT